MANIGDDAAAAGMALVPGTLPANQLDTEDNRTRDYIAQGTARWKTGTPAVTVAQGGTGATTASAARTALGFPALSAPGVATDNGIAVFGPDKRLQVQDPSLPSDAATKFYVDGAVSAGVGSVDLSSRVAKAGDVMSGGLTINGPLLIPFAPPAAVSYVVAYHQGTDGQVCRGTSSARFKDDIDRAPVIPDVFAVPIAAYTMKEDPGKTVRYGPIAEDLDAAPETQGFVNYDAEGLPESFDQISYLLAAVARLDARVKELEHGSTD